MSAAVIGMSAAVRKQDRTIKLMDDGSFIFLVLSCPPALGIEDRYGSRCLCPKCTPVP